MKKFVIRGVANPLICSRYFFAEGVKIRIPRGRCSDTISIDINGIDILQWASSIRRVSRVIDVNLSTWRHCNLNMSSIMTLARPNSTSDNNHMTRIIIKGARPSGSTKLSGLFRT